MILATRSVAKTFSMWLGSRLVLPFQLVLRKWRSEVSERRMAAHRKSDRRRDYLCAGGFRKRAFFLVATVTGIALERFDALTRDNRNYENCGYSRFHTSIRCHRDSKRKKTRIARN